MYMMKESLWMVDTPPAPVQCSPTPTSSAERPALYEKFKSRMAANPALDRTLVSYQANKQTPFSSWFKYREGFSDVLVCYLVEQLHPEPGVLLDPFSGSGSALFSAGALGWRTKGIEVLPVGIYATKARQIAARMEAERVYDIITHLKQVNFAAWFDQTYALAHIAITRGAFPVAEENQLVGFRAYCDRAILDDDMRVLLQYAAFCILEEISYTRKDGQYLRWDARSGRSQGKKPFNKGYIRTFREALFNKLEQIAHDLDKEAIQQPLFQVDTLVAKPAFVQEPELHEGSCLELLPEIGCELSGRH